MLRVIFGSVAVEPLSLALNEFQLVYFFDESYLLELIGWIHRKGEDPDDFNADWKSGKLLVTFGYEQMGLISYLPVSLDQSFLKVL
ncbi:hypothetical protein [Algoriphagus winogradskyi]|uniref:Uncharacterized protein n=1 Tax=Algoriphagus winogradskyi TaxID=237017 RepID=A0ABY1PA22_9BACT|nr:hypothetical protein [Algoriphagus winogradskyi]SMP28512.1 hypothetical protein SAMN06265367_1067 [Algoriphagus winogradskyi]